MGSKKKVFAIIGSASSNSANLKLVQKIAELGRDDLEISIYNKLAELPHFNPELSLNGTPEIVLKFRQSVQDADAVLICTPEYVFSIPSGLKNAIEWCVSTTVFSKKPVGLITASAHGAKGHEELQLIMRTIESEINEDATLLIQGIKGKINDVGEIKDDKTLELLTRFIKEFGK